MTQAPTMPLDKASRLLRRVRLELARDPAHPEGSRLHGYDFIAPIDEHGAIVPEAWRALRERCRVRRFAPDTADEVGHLVHKPGGSWAFHYDIHGDPAHDETGFRFDHHKLAPGEYVSIKEQDGVLRTFQVKSVAELE
jgi:hypothetical protein